MDPIFSNISYPEIAEYTGYGRVHISNVMRGVRTGSDRCLGAIAVALDVSVEDLSVYIELRVERPMMLWKRK